MGGWATYMERTGGGGDDDSDEMDKQRNSIGTVLGSGPAEDMSKCDGRSVNYGVLVLEPAIRQMSSGGARFVANTNTSTSMTMTLVS